MQHSILQTLRDHPELAHLAFVPRPEAPTRTTVQVFLERAAELDALRGGCGLIDLSDKNLLRVAGADAEAFLQRILANDVRELGDGDWNHNLLLTPRGKVQLAFELARIEEGVYELSLPPAGAESASAALDAYLFTEDVELIDQSEHSAPLLVAGPRADHVVERLMQREEAGAFELRPMRFATRRAFELEAGPQGFANLWSVAREEGATQVGLEAREIARVEAGEPWFGCDVDDTVFPQEAGLEEWFSLDKGCYVGQEVVAKIETYGGLNRELVGWKLSDETPIPHGTAVTTVEGKEAGIVTSWVRSPALGTGLALGYVKRRMLSKTNEFRIGNATASVIELPVGPASG